MSANRQQSDSNNSTPYNRLGLVELEQLMDYTFYEDTSDPETLSELLKEYKKRKGIKTADSAETWSDFQKHYSMHDETFPVVIEDVDNSKQILNIAEGRKTRRFINIKRLGIVAAAFIVISTLFFSATAHGSSIWQAIAQWGRETFGFSERAISVQKSEELISLHEALAAHNITELLAPTWIPDGFELTELDVAELPQQLIFTALFEYSERNLIIMINVLDKQTSNIYERNDSEIYTFHRNGIDHHIMDNMDMTKVVWMNKNYECLVTGNITVGDAQLMINSIYER